MTIALSLALLAQAATATGGTLDWDRLTPLPWRTPPQMTSDLSRFVADEVLAKRCVPPKREDARALVDVDVAVLVRADGLVRVAVPRAIDCPTVEQFAAGLVTSFARNNLRATPEGWYRASVTFPLR
ncbi:hypothetical protein [Sphingomonas sp.]|uniref:hypothetical protein n=1 Tax=Sphingomonas sp. TaxID=28214 RepID=UPI002CA60DDC|nr:hypothetical protein [Sphingomonas sp.]HWK36207.1 hypothetical protein [Sphingomonas sp.]